MYSCLILTLVTIFLTAVQAVPAEKPWYTTTSLSQTIHTPTTTNSSSSSSTSLSNMSDAIPVANNKDLLTDESSASNSSSISVTSTNANLTPWLGENRWAIDVNKTSGNTLVVTMFVFQWQIRQGGNGIAQQVSWFYDWAKELQASKSRPVFYKVDPDVEFPAVMLRTSPTVVYWKKGKEVGRVEGVARPDTWKARANSLTPWTY